MSQIKNSVKSIGETISVCISNNLTFAAYRLPNQPEQTLIVQKKPGYEKVTSLSDITNMKGFFVAPFLQSEKINSFIINPDYWFNGMVSDIQFELITRLKHPEQNINQLKLPYEVTKSEYLQQIYSIINTIRIKKIQKAVLSRIKLVAGNFENLLPAVFDKLCDLFPNAFVYIFRAGDHCWMGATPEPFANLKNNEFQTSSVAGTKENTKKYLWIENWGYKEKQEQNYVSDFIGDVLKKNNWENIVQRGPYVDKAGNVLHLRTDFTSRANFINGNVGELLKNLHPTPAVCGSPAGEALEIILSSEKHDREYYGGFLGPVGLENTMLLFVNLRCMKITSSHLHLFSGGGITIDSNPVDEWYETEIKTGTLLSALKNFTHSDE
jgi:isochorismate synthase